MRRVTHSSSIPSLPSLSLLPPLSFSSPLSPPLPSLLTCPPQVHLEKLEPHSQRRIPGPKVQHMWSQSLYILCGLLQGGLLAVGEIDPLNRRLSMMVKPDPLVQGEEVWRVMCVCEEGGEGGYLCIHILLEDYPLYMKCHPLPSSF